MQQLPYKKIYFVGIKGVGMAALAIIAKQAGFTVCGSDTAASFITDQVLDKHEIVVNTDFLPEDLERFIGDDRKETLIIVTAAHKGLDNPQAIYAKTKHCNVLTFGQALGMFQYGTLLNREDIIGISIAGTHGKTTTTAMLATVVSEIGLDPSYLIGTSDVSSLGDPGRYGQGKYFIVESDEYISDGVHDRVPKFYYQHPHAAIVTNIDFDHPDVFDDLEHVYQAFETFIKNIQIGGTLVILGDNPEYASVYASQRDSLDVVTYGLQDKNTYQAVDVANSKDGISYSVQYKGEILGKISMPVIGIHMVLNSLAVVALLHTMSQSFEDIAKGLKIFTGTKRRLEYKGETHCRAMVIDDYAHHPVEISATLSALAATYPEKKIICIFQPHTFSRTKSLIDDFAHAFKNAHEVLLLPIFSSAREGAIDPAAEATLYAKILANKQGKVIENAQNVVKYCTQNFNSPDYILVTMGAGDVYKISDTLIKVKS